MSNPAAKRGAVGAVAWLVAVALSLLYLRGVVGAAVIMLLGLLTLSGGLAAVVGPLLRRRTHPSAPVRTVTVVVGMAIALAGVLVTAAGVVRLIDGLPPVAG